jgi:O-Antigen ligase
MDHASSQPLSIIQKALLIVAPMCLFIDPASEILLHNVVGFEEERLAYPISIVMIVLIPFLILKESNKTAYQFLFYAALPITLSIFYAGIFGSIEPILVAFTWMAPFIWLAGFMSMDRAPHDKHIVRWLSIGCIISTSYLLLAGTLEIVIYGALQDAGRMTTNFVLPGHYQLYVYMPTMTAFSTIIILGAIKAKLISFFKFDFIVVMTLGAIALVFMAAREAILSYLFALVLIFLATTKIRLFLISVFLPLIAILIVSNIDSLANYAAASEIKSLRKFSQFNEAGQTLGARDLAIVDYYEVFIKFPVFGTGFRSPFKNYFGILTEFPSAHNYYVDVMAWGGLVLTFIIFPMMIYLLFKSNKVFLLSIDKKGYFYYYRAIGASLVIAILFSNNINVPFRAPLLAPLFGFLMFGVLAGEKYISNRSPVRQ